MISETASEVLKAEPVSTLGPYATIINGIFLDYDQKGFAVATNLGFHTYSISSKSGLLTSVVNEELFNQGLDYALRFFQTDVFLVSPSTADESLPLRSNCIYAWDADLKAVISVYECDEKVRKVIAFKSMILAVQKCAVLAFEVKSGEKYTVFEGADFLDADVVSLKGRKQLIAILDAARGEVIVMGHTFEHFTRFPFKAEPATFISFSSDARYLLAANRTSCKVYDTVKFEEEFQFRMKFPLISKLLPAETRYVWLVSETIILVFHGCQSYKLLHLNYPQGRSWLAQPLSFDFSTDFPALATQFTSSIKPVVCTQLEYYDQKIKSLSSLLISIFHFDGCLYKISYDLRRQLFTSTRDQTPWLRALSCETDDFVLL